MHGGLCGYCTPAGFVVATWLHMVQARVVCV